MTTSPFYVKYPMSFNIVPQVHGSIQCLEGEDKKSERGEMGLCPRFIAL